MAYKNIENKTYYAHSMRIYGTKEEKNNIKFLKDSGFNILCPHNDLGKLGGIQPYLDIVKKCKDVIVTEYQGHIGRGAYSELQTALDNNKPVLVLRDKTLYSVKNIKVYDSNDWKINYGSIII